MRDLEAYLRRTKAAERKILTRRQLALLLGGFLLFAAGAAVGAAGDYFWKWPKLLIDTRSKILVVSPH